MLPDYLAPNLDLVFCGTAAGKRSAELGQYYAGVGNSFWKTLVLVGLTPKLLAPSDGPELPGIGIGLTDLAKGVAGMDRDIPESAFIPDRLRSIVAKFRPKGIAFNGKKAAEVALGKKQSYGQLPAHDLGEVAVWIMPSTSGAARGFFDIDPWRDLAKWRSGLARD